ncbi:hypothetical protein FACS1894106_5450 [Spirochaetia bacterium]|nr:hypothetical protein FACS1894106_5450 [Spirochaetia bacterium]
MSIIQGLPDPVLVNKKEAEDYNKKGRRIDYLGEGIWIGSPLGRDAL